MPVLGASSNRIFTPPQGPGKFGSWTWPIKKTPLFASITQTPVNLRNEVRLSLTPFPIWLFDYDLAYLKGAEYIPNTANNSALAYVLGFFGQSLGVPQSWLFQDPFDNQVSNEPFGWGDGVTTQFQLQRSINDLFPDIIQNPNSISNISVGGGTPTPISGNGYYIGLENLLQQSQAFQTSPWTVFTSGGASAPSFTSGQTAPDGTNTAFQISFPSTSGTQGSYLFQPITGFACAGQTFTFSIWMKSASPCTVTMAIQDSSPAFVSCQQALVNVGTSWTRISITGTFPSVLIPGYGLNVLFGNVQSQPAASIVAWGAQLERNPNPSGYILTTTNYLIPNGVVTFRIAPPAGSQLTWSGSFWFRCRFDEDQLADLRQGLYQIWDLASLKFRSVILGDV